MFSLRLCKGETTLHIYASRNCNIRIFHSKRKDDASPYISQYCDIKTGDAVVFDAKIERHIKFSQAQKKLRHNDRLFRHVYGLHVSVMMAMLRHLFFISQPLKVQVSHL